MLPRQKLNVAPFSSFVMLIELIDVIGAKFCFSVTFNQCRVGVGPSGGTRRTSHEQDAHARVVQSFLTDSLHSNKDN